MFLPLVLSVYFAYRLKVTLDQRCEEEKVEIKDIIRDEIRKNFYKLLKTQAKIVVFFVFVVLYVALVVLLPHRMAHNLLQLRKLIALFWDKPLSKIIKSQIYDFFYREN